MQLQKSAAQAAGYEWLWRRVTPALLRLADAGVDQAAHLASTLELPHESPTLRVHRLHPGAGNAYLLETGQGMILVDAGLPHSEQVILARMAELGRDDLRLIFITHAHVDHYGSAAALRRATGAPIAIHRADAADMAAGHTRLGSIRDWGWTQTTLPLLEPLLRVEPTEADLVLDEGDLPAQFGLDAQVVHTPGHTPGSCTLLVQGRYAFAGDLISSNGGAHIQRAYAQDWSQIAAGLEALRRIRPDYVFPGHGSTPVTGEMLAALAIDGPAAARSDSRAQP